MPLRSGVNVNCDGEGRIVSPDANAVQDSCRVPPGVGCLGLSCSDWVISDVASLVEITSRSPSESESQSAWVLYRTDSDNSEESGSVRVTTG